MVAARTLYLYYTLPEYHVTVPSLQRDVSMQCLHACLQPASNCDVSCAHLEVAGGRIRLKF